jgi:hypothetical protein
MTTLDIAIRQLRSAGFTHLTVCAPAPEPPYTPLEAFARAHRDDDCTRTRPPVRTLTATC